MQKLFQVMSAGVLSAFAAGAVSAADLPRRAPPPPPPLVVAPFNWTGCHVGVNVGGAYDDYHFAVSAQDPFAGGFTGRNKVYTSGPIGGGQAGCDYQLPWNIVVGVEGDLDGAAVHGSKSAVAPLVGGVVPGLLGGVSTATRVDAFGSLRVRVGYAFDRLLFTDNVLVYLTAGAGYGSIHDTATAFAGPSSATWTRNRHPFGAGKEPGVVGIGVEKMITPNFSIDVQYHYHYMGAATPVINLFPAGQAGFGTRSMYHLARVGLNYHFNWGAPAPVVARY